MNNNFHKIIAAAILAVGMVIGSIFIGNSWVKSRSVQFVTVKGLSEREVVADRGWWGIQARYVANTVEGIQAQIDKNEATVMAFLQENGFSEEEIKLENINIFQDQYNNQAQPYAADIRIGVHSDDVEKIERASSKISELISKGVLITGDKWSNGPKYYYTDFKEIKTDMLAEATQEAKKAAEEFAGNSDSKVGKIKRANQGIFQILPGNRTNENAEFFREKIVRVVSTVEYFLE